ncbi:MAG: lipoate--protein ligase family protein [Spirochaetales bacterium]|nr:lipoate--protein ligase family protein [Spirochaetales bacterium]
MQLTIIRDDAMTGKANMEKDEWLLAQGAPALRFYSWEPSCVSVGYFQNIERDIDTEFCRQNNIDIVRRPTGGRAVLHDRELTYSVVLPEKYLPAGVIASYKFIAGMFVNALKSFGITAEVKGPEGRGGRSGVCFAEPSAYEISVDGKKLIGSAQVRRNGTVLQHGSILLDVDYEKHSKCMKGRSFIQSEKLKTMMIGLYSLAVSRPSSAAVADSIIKSFLLDVNAFGIKPLSSR